MLLALYSPNVNQQLGKTTQATEFQDLAKGLEQAFTTYANASIKRHL
jgi:hypothetical protein